MAYFVAELINDDVNDDDNENLRAGVMLSNAKHLAQCNEDKSLSETNCEILRDAQDDKHNVKQCAEQYKISFVAINEYYQRLTGCDYDEKCKNATRLSGMAHDPEVYYNPDAAAHRLVLRHGQQPALPHRPHGSPPLAALHD